MHGGRTDVAIIGGGVSGLALARHLTERGRTATVLEARDRVGGRLESPGGLDLGATWFWANEPRVQRLIEDLGLETFPQHLDGDARYHDPGGSRRLDGNPVDVPARRFVEGAESLAQAMAASLPAGVVRLDAPVNQVEAAPNDPTLRVTMASGDHVEADHVALAIPPALAVATVSFDPLLPDRVVGVARTTPVWMGNVTKVVARYPRAFWRDEGCSGSAISHLGPMREIHDLSGPDGDPAALFGFAPATAVGAPTVTEAQALGQLTEIFGPEAAHPSALMIRDWRTEHRTSPPEVERLVGYRSFGHDQYQRASLGGRLHWTSTETATQYPGHIEGALEAAERTATAIAP